MESNAADKPVPREINALLSDGRLILRETQRAVTPFGGIAVFISFLGKIGFVEAVRQHMPVRWRSPNHIDPSCTFTAFLVSVLGGARRFAHASLLRGDRALHALLGMNRFPTDDTIRNLFRQFGMGQVQRLFEPLTEWQRLPRRPEGYTLDLDSTVFERYGQQEGSLKRSQPAQTRSSQPSSSAGRAERSALSPPRLAPQRPLRNQPWRGGVSQRSSRAVGTTRKDSLAESRFGLLRRQAAELSGTAPAALHCSRATHTLGETRRSASGAMDHPGPRLRRRRVSAPAAWLGPGAALRSHSRAGARGTRQRRPQTDRVPTRGWLTGLSPASYYPEG